MKVQALLASPLLACEDDFYAMDDDSLTRLAREDVLCHYLAQQARLRGMRQESPSPLAGVINLHLHVMHSLGNVKKVFSCV
jgi:hypothetical protein